MLDEFNATFNDRSKKLKDISDYVLNKETQLLGYIWNIWVFLDPKAEEESRAGVLVDWLHKEGYAVPDKLLRQDHASDIECLKYLKKQIKQGNLEESKVTIEATNCIKHIKDLFYFSRKGGCNFKNIFKAFDIFKEMKECSNNAFEARFDSSKMPTDFEKIGGILNKTTKKRDAKGSDKNDNALMKHEQWAQHPAAQDLQVNPEPEEGGFSTPEPVKKDFPQNFTSTKTGASFHLPGFSSP